MELIDREAVREFIKSYRHSTDVAFDMEKRLDEIPAAYPWHRVEEPPKQYGAFAVACVYDGKFYWCKGIYLDGKWLREGNGIEIPADYWMPIEPPKEDA